MGRRKRNVIEFWDEFGVRNKVKGQNLKDMMKKISDKYD